MAGQETQREREGIAIERRGLRLSQRFELRQQGLVEPGQVQEHDGGNCRNGREPQRPQPAHGPAALRGIRGRQFWRPVHTPSTSKWAVEVEARVGIEPA